MQDPALERNWAGAAAALLLAGARSGSNLKKPLFSNSLGECVYTPYQVGLPRYLSSQGPQSVPCCPSWPMVGKSSSAIVAVHA